LIAVVSTIIYFVLFYPGFQLKNIVISGNVKVGTKDLQDIVSKYSNTGLVNFASMNIVSKSIFLINEEKISTDILKAFPDIDTLKINKSLPQTLILGVIERKPIGVFCDIKEKCFLIDQSGIVFEPLSVPSVDSTIVRQVFDGGQVFTGEQVVNQNVMSAIYNIQRAIKDNSNMSIKEALVVSSSRLNVTTSANWQAYFDLSSGSDINLQITKLNALLTGGISADDMKNLHYIDLRPKDRAIVCDNKTCGN
jgi:cell division septal protein FtsQ